MHKMNHRATTFSHTLTRQLISETFLEIIEGYINDSGPANHFLTGIRGAMSELWRIQPTPSKVTNSILQEEPSLPCGLRIGPELGRHPSVMHGWNWDIDRTVYPDFEDMVSELMVWAFGP